MESTPQQKINIKKFLRKKMNPAAVKLLQKSTSSSAQKEPEVLPFKGESPELVIEEPEVLPFRESPEIIIEAPEVSPPRKSPEIIIEAPEVLPPRESPELIIDDEPDEGKAVEDDEYYENDEYGLISAVEQARQLLAASKNSVKKVTKPNGETKSNKRPAENGPTTPGKQKRVELITLSSPKTKII